MNQEIFMKKEMFNMWAFCVFAIFIVIIAAWGVNEIMQPPKVIDPKPCVHDWANTQYALLMIHEPKQKSPEMCPFQFCTKCGTLRAVISKDSGNIQSPVK